MPWFQPTSSPPTASMYMSAHQQSLPADEEECEFEFGEPRSRQNNHRGQRQTHHREDFLLHDPLSRRLMSLLNPLSGSCTGAGSDNGGGGSGGFSTAPYSFGASVPPASHYWDAFAGRHEIEYPHPSYGHRQRESEAGMQMQFQHGIDNDNDHGAINRNGDKDGENIETYGYDEHAYFFHPRRIIADEPFVGDDHGRYDQQEGGSQQYQYNNKSFNHGNGSENLDIHVNVFAASDADAQWNDNEAQWSQQHRHPYQQQPQTTQQHYNHPNNDNDDGVHQRYGFNYPEETIQQQRRKRKKQRRIVQHDNDGNPTLGISSSSSPFRQNSEQSWAQVGQIASYQNRDAQQLAESRILEGDNDDTSNKSKKKKKKRKKRKKKDEDDGHDQERSMSDIRASMIAGQKKGAQDDPASIDNSNGIDRDDGEDFQEKAPRAKKWSKAKGYPKNLKRPRSSSANNARDTSSPSPPPFKPLSIEDMHLFAETYEVKNAGSSPESLDAFLQILRRQKYVTWTMVFHDEICSTPFLPSTKKYCTPKGKPCTMWNCTCENQVRAVQASKPLVGCMFVFPMNNDDPDDSDAVDGGGNSCDLQTSSIDLDCFLLPLCPTVDPEEGPKDIDPGYERMANFPYLPMSCDTTLKQRWETLRSILIDRHLVKVTFNAAMGLMPYHYHCANDIPTETLHEMGDSSGTTSVATGYLDLVLPNMWDLRLASWMLSPHAEEETLEMKDKKEGFARLYPQRKFSIPDNATKQVVGLVEAKEQLEFLYVIYPIVDKLLETKGLKHAFCEIESPAQSVLSSMECLGIGFKAERLIKIQNQIEEKIESLNAEAREISKDCNFVLSSPQQVSKLLFDKMGLTVPELPGKQKYSNQQQQQRSTSEESLKAMQKEIKAIDGKGLRIIDLVLEFRGLNKVLSTYIRPYPKLARGGSNFIHIRGARTRSKKKSNPSSSRVGIQKIHPMWMQTAVRTGRLSCRKPNLQQVPNGSVFGVCPRTAFTAYTRDSCLFACDYSQNEVRILAHMSNDEALIELFTNPGTTDIYKQMSSVISGKNADEVTDKERAIAKQVTLAIMYGMGINSVAKKLDVNKKTAQAFFRSFYGRFQGVKRWMEQTITFARNNKYVTTISGRRRYLDNITSGDRALKSQAERQAINTVIQGSAADLMKLAMLKMASRISDWRKEVTGTGTSAPPKMLLQIHDELLFELQANEADVNMLKSVVTRCCTEECVEELQLKVPLKLKCSVGTSWGSMKDI